MMKLVDVLRHSIALQDFSAWTLKEYVLRNVRKTQQSVYMGILSIQIPVLSSLTAQMTPLQSHTADYA